MTSPSTEETIPSSIEVTITPTSGIISTPAVTLSQENEVTLLSFQIMDSNKYVTISTTEKEDYIIYRYGTQDKIELEYPTSLSDSWSLFTYSYYFRGGGVDNEGMELNSLTFENDGYTYTIYEDYYALGTSNVGILITPPTFFKEYTLTGDFNTIYGSLRSLKDNDKITISE